ncbi:ABC-F family ATP-binding cassette domain-containing protein [Frigoribacterium sp. VKM Ac-1396]|uniref:ABC-F family ATP-binding cassette domain-containing protein n=1 Tax=Frigoribacterium sp. VKM Ac-1396 TaxID=2783821 RepID=UPI00188B3FCB|nr:ABC-F family ATP-binding cassette domain-containing protein [Frigoribacterium sp. VKM Ac-1396]MBF4600951.1 ABC-F family ATP-binding cassette domain-containing protein [Frigoribacterium sp. VKM Ac-1396]
MSASLVAKGLAGGHGHRTLFDDLDLTVAPGDVVGVVGVNGAGKSTLLRLLAGVDEPQAGTVTLSPGDAFVGWLPQEHDRVPGETVADYIGRRTGSTQATAEMDAAAAALGDPDPAPRADGLDPADVYSTALDRWLASGAADLDERLPQVLADLGLATPRSAAGSDDEVAVGPDSPMTGLSGGQAARVGLAALLLSRFDVALLDEPTNDLDLDGLERLERFVQGQRGGIVLVSHDREFLARCVTKVLELDLAQSSNRVFGGGYDAYLDERETARRHAREAYDEFADKKADLVGRARTQREWSSQGVRNAMKKAPDNDKIRRKASAESSEKQAQKVRQMESRIARLDEVDEPRKEWQLEFTIGAAPRSSAVVSTLIGAVFRQGDPATGEFVLGPVSVQVNGGDRIGITGPNGAGKSTLLRGLLGRQAPSVGGASRGASIAVGEIDQARALLAGDVPLADAFEALVPDWPQAEVRTLLAKFGLKADHVSRPVDELSPGERTRAGLALLQARGVNVLVLDEPTNHLDLAAIEQLEQALESYDGTLLLVTHDRRMLETVRLDRHWRVDGGTVTES